MSNFDGLNVAPKLTNNEKYNHKQAFNVMGILGIFVAILLILSLIGSLRSGAGGYTFSFSGLLEYLSNAPQINPEFSLSKWTIDGDWGLFDFLRDFFNLNAKIMGFATWFSILIWNALEYVAYFFSFLFAIG